MVDASGRKVIGSRSGDFDSSMGAVWIRGFKEGETQLRILNPTDDWWRYKEHYGGSKEIGYFPCMEDPSCVGCNDLSERVRKTTTKYAFNAVAADGSIRVFKLGSQLKKKLKSREQKMGNDVLQRRDIKIIRIGSGFGDTEYDYEWEDEYELDKPPGEDDIHNLPQVVTDAYYAVAEAYERGDVPDHDEELGDVPEEPEARTEAPAKKTAPAKRAAAARPAEPDPEPEPAAPAKKTAAKKVVSRRPAPEPEPEEPAAAQEPAGDEAGEDVPDGFDAMSAKIREMDTEPLRDLLNQHNVEFPPRAARPRLIAFAEQAVLDGVIPPF